MTENKRRTILAVILATTIIIGLVGTYAYFVTQGSTIKQNLTVQTGTLALTFEDNTDGFDAQLNLGESASKEFIIRNTGNQPVTTKMYWKNLTNTYLKESLSYKLEYKTSADGEWQDVTTITSTNVPRALSTSTKELATNLTIPVGGVYYYKLTIRLENLEDINQDVDKNAIMNTKFTIGEESVTPEPSAETTLKALKITSNGEKASFDTLATNNEGVFEMADDYGTSYYYRGAVDNNYVKFGGFYWRIIRVNGDGSIRMIYDGTKAHMNGEVGDEDDRFIQTGIAYNWSYNDNAYVGWMYGTPGSSNYASTHTVTKSSEEAPIKKNVVDPWYDNNIINNKTNNKDLSGYLGDEIFCNDRSMPGTSGWSTDTKKGFGTNVTAYGAAGRFVDVSTGSWLPKTNQQPTFVCPQGNDMFTVSVQTIKGKQTNGSLTRKIGLITADEVIAAGAKYYMKDGTSNNKSYYLYRNKWYWSLSPRGMVADGGASVFPVNADGFLGWYTVNNTDGAVAPVINISAEYAATLTGSGIIGDEYKIPGVE